MIITLPWPPAELNPNRKNGKHWSSTHKVKTRYKSDCYHLALQAIGAKPRGAGLLALTITFVQPDKIRRDRDNMLASIKSGLDGVAMALGVDDETFDPLIIRREFGAKPGCVRVEVA